MARVIYHSEEGEMTTQTMPACRESSKSYFNFESIVVIRSWRNIWRMLQEMRRTVRRRFRTRSYLLLALTSSQNYQKKSGAVYCFRSWPTKQLMCPTKKICLWFRFSPLRRRYLRRSNQATNLNAISDLGLSMDDCRGQSYDGLKTWLAGTLVHLHLFKMLLKKLHMCTAWIIDYIYELPILVRCKWWETWLEQSENSLLSFPIHLNAKISWWTSSSIYFQLLSTEL